MQTIFGNRMPGLATEQTCDPRLVDVRDPRVVAGVLAGASARDPLSAVVTDLRAGLLLGRITASGKYAPSIIGVTSAAVLGTDTHIHTLQPTLTELGRRCGASGTFNLIGPQAAGGLVRKQTVTYSSVAGTVLQVDTTALGPAAENEVWTVTLNAAMTAGVIGFGVYDIDGSVKWVRAAWTTDWAGTLVVLNAAANAIFGTGSVVFTGTATVPIITYTLLAYSGRAFPAPLVDITGCTGPASITSIVRTVEGHSDGFATGSLICPIDGSESPCAVFLGQDGYAIPAIDELLANRDISVPNLVISAGYVVGSTFINWPTDTALIAWIKAQLRLRGTWVFEDDFVTV